MSERAAAVEYGYVRASARALTCHPSKENLMNTRTIAILALVIAVILVLALFVF